MRGALFTRIGLAATAALLLPLFLPLSAQAAAPDYGSIAYSPSKRIVVAGLAESQSAAETAAVQKCRAQGGAADCWALDWFHNAVGAFARASNPANDPAYGSGQGWADTLTDATRNAEKAAVKTCQQYGGEDCEIIPVDGARTSTVSSSGTGDALTRPLAGGGSANGYDPNNPFGLKALPYTPGDTGATGIMYLPDIPDYASCSVDLITSFPPLSGYKLVKVGQFLGTSYGIFYDAVHDQNVLVTAWHAVPLSSCVDLVTNILNTPPPWAFT